MSKLHARVADYRDLSGEKVHFAAITNGIHLQTWVMPEILHFYKNSGIIDKFNMPGHVTAEQIRQIFRANTAGLRKLKRLGRQQLNAELRHRCDQYGNKVNIPEDAILFEFKRRFVEYKRPWMPFEDVNRLKKILLDNDAHYIMAGMIAGNVSPNDSTYQKLESMLQRISDDPILRERVHLHYRLRRESSQDDELWFGYYHQRASGRPRGLRYVVYEGFGQSNIASRY